MRSIIDWNNPPSSSNVRDYILVELFDPRVNVLPHSQSVTEAQWHNWIKSIWCIENIIENWNMMFQLLPFTEDRLEMVKRIPSDLLWCLHYCCFFQPDGSNRIKYVYGIPYNVYSGSMLEYVCHRNSRRSDYSYRTENWDNELHRVLNEIKTAIDSHLQAYGHKFRYYYSNPEHQNCRLSLRMSEYASNQVICTDPSGEAHVRSTLLEYLTTHPEATLYNSTTDNIRIAIRIPINRENRSALYRVFNYSTSPLSMLDWPLTAKGEHNPILYGVELEFSSNYSAQQLVDAAETPFFILKNDSSVTGSKRIAYELVTVPASFKALKKQFAYFFSNLDYSEFDTSKDTNNGMHVHISPDAFVDEKHKNDFAWFFTQPAHHEFMQALSERNSSSMQNYTAMPQHSERDSRIRAYQNNERACKRVRGCINYSNKGTIEVRLFRGIVSLADVLKNLEFVDSILHFTMDRKLLTKLTLDNYFKWLTQQPRNKYAILRKYFDTNTKLTPHIKSAAILDLIFTEKNPDKILQILKKSPLKITNEHVTILNRKWKKRIFVLDKDTGELKLNDTNKSSVSFLDRLVEAKILGKHKKGATPVSPPRPAAQPEEPYEEDYVSLSDIYIPDDFTSLTVRRMSA